MINKTAVDILRGQIADLKSIRNQLLPLARGQDIGPIFDKLNDYYEQLLTAIGYEPGQADDEPQA